MNSQQFHRDEQNRGDLPQADTTRYATPPSHMNTDVTHASGDRSTLGAGTDVMGEPMNPLSGPGHATATSAASSGLHTPANASSAGTYPPSISPTSETYTPANVLSATGGSAGNFPTTQMPQTLSTPANQSGASQPATAQGASPYVQTSSVPGATGKTPMDSIMQVFNKWSKKAEDMTGNVWNHLKTGPNVADTALGRIAVGTKAMSEGGLENVYRQTFEVAPDEHLLKTYACYLSTSTGPVAGTLYISSHKLAFCSDRPLAIPSPNQAGNNKTTNPQASSVSTTSSNKSSAQQQQQQQWCYYKVMVPISQVESVNPSENTQKKPPEKYVQVKTEDGHEFWFMGFVNYSKGVKNLQETILQRTNNPNINSATHVVNQA